MTFPPLRFFGLVFLALASASPGAASGPPATLVASGFDYSLITPGAGDKTLRVTFPSAAPIASIKAEVRAYGIRADIIRKPLSTQTTPVSAFASASTAAATRDVKVAISLPRLGLYDITLTALDSAGETLAETSVSYAAVPPRTDVGPSDFGVATHLARNLDAIPRSLDLLKLAGFSRIRDEIAWSTVERRPGIFAFSANQDALVKDATDRGIHPLILFDYGNAGVYPAEFSGGKGFPENAAARALFVRYATELVKRYGSRVKTWEVWNEPQAWGKPSVENYTLLLKEVYAAVKKTDPSAYVIGCGGGGAGGGPGGDYVGGVVSHGGLDSMDGFSIHPYISAPGTPDFGYGALNAPVPRVNIPLVSQHLGSFIDNPKNLRGDGKKLDLWLTEFGVVSSPTSFVKGGPFQALFLSHAYLLARRYGRIKALFWYDFINDGVSPENPEHNFGLIRGDFSPKPAYVAAAVLTRTLGDRPWTRAFFENGVVSVQQYGDDSDAVIAGWTERLVGEFVTLRVKPGNYILRDWQGGEKEIEIGSKGYLWKIDALPQYLIPKK